MTTFENRGLLAEILGRHGCALGPSDWQPEPFDVVAWRRERAAELLARQVPAMFTDASLDDTEHGEVASWARRFLADPANCPNLLLSGPTGVGKTWLVWALLRHLLESRAEQGRGLTFRHTSQPALNDLLRPKADGSHEYALEPYLTAEVVVLDDLGAGKQTDWTGDSLYRLVDRRWSDNRPTVFTTNLPPQVLVEAVGDRVVSRLGDATRIVLKGEDRRWAGAR